jgi:CMP-N,N'-diacetyllegionaminic acid synthase
MEDMRNYLAVITARSGSKGLPDKNIKILSGKPMLAYTIEAAKKSRVFDSIMVSTDSPEYASIACQYGAEVPFLRSEELSSDTASSWDVVLEVLKKYESIGKRFDCVALLQPTSPLRSYEDIIGAANLFKGRSAGAVVSVCEIDHPAAWMNTLDESLSMEQFIKQEYKEKRRQDLPVYYRLNGAIYIVDYKFLIESQDIYRQGCYAYIMPRERSVDIDTINDFLYAEILMGKQDT